MTVPQLVLARKVVALVTLALMVAVYVAAYTVRH
jgi:hypothetical protein